MDRHRRTLPAFGSVLITIALGSRVFAQNPGGILRVTAGDSPPSMSMHEEVPDLATGWSWSADGNQLTFPLRQGFRWHDGRTFTAKDVKCTWDLLAGTSADKLRLKSAQIVVSQPRGSHHQ